MSDSYGPKDEATNEIMSSIRRIISEDNAQPGGPKVAAEQSDEDILDLTEEATEDEGGGPRLDPSFGAARDSAQETSIRREPVLGLHSPAPDTSEMPAETEAEDTEPEISHPAIEAFGGSAQQEGAELSDQHTEPAPEVAAEPEPEPSIQPEAQVEPAPAIVPEAAAEPMEAAGHGEAAIESPEVKTARSKADIVSDTATAATASAIGELTRVMEEKSSKLKLGTEDETISDIVKEMLRPMLREWLDENLPGIVERIVRREIQKLVDRAEADD
jgi:cell pole-organizing protein PopZ